VFPCRPSHRKAEEIFSKEILLLRSLLLYMDKKVNGTYLPVSVNSSSQALKSKHLSFKDFKKCTGKCLIYMHWFEAIFQAGLKKAHETELRRTDFLLKMLLTD